MTEPEAFTDLMERIRSGDSDAAARLVLRFEPEIRRRVRVWIRMRAPEQRAVFESMDVSQSVLASFFQRVSEGGYDLGTPEQVLNLLVVMARHKVMQQVRDGRRQRRDARRTRPLDDGAPLLAVEDSPSQIVSDRELLEKFRDRLTLEEAQVADLRADGLEWAEVAERLGGTAEGRRKQWARVVARVSQSLGIGPTNPM